MFVRMGRKEYSYMNIRIANSILLDYSYSYCWVGKIYNLLWCLLFGWVGKNDIRASGFWVGKS